MSGTDLQHLFATVLTDPAPDTTDVEAAMRTVRRRRRVRTGALMLSAAAVVAVIALVVGGVLDRTAAPQPAASPSAVEGPVTEVPTRRHVAPLGDGRPGVTRHWFRLRSPPPGDSGVEGRLPRSTGFRGEARRRCWRSWSR
jgi:hypothetical protein